jgi:hypothetical protein
MVWTKRRGALILAVVAILASASGEDRRYESAYPEAVIQALTTALAALKADLSDLNYEKKYAPSDFRLKVVDLTLDQPLSLMALAREWEPHIASPSLADSFALAANLLEHPVQKTPSPAGHDPPLKVLLSALDAVAARFPTAFQDLSPDEQSYLYERLPYLFLREEQSFQNRPPPKYEERIWEYVKKVRMEQMYQPVAEFLTVLEDLLEKNADAGRWIPSGVSSAAPAPDFVSGEILYAERTNLGWVIVGGKGPNRYRCRCYLIVDTGGDDIYEQSAPPPYPSYSTIIDLAGDDRYEGGEVSVAGAYFGMSVIADLGGNDWYRGSRVTLGAALMGAGLLLDASGDDHYAGDTLGMGAGGFGIGILKDLAGNDTYEGAFFAQGFASTGGVGILSDLSGNDVYIAGRKYLHQPLYADVYQSLSQGFSIGMRDLQKGGGVGILYDGSGNDAYTAEVYCQGAGYWYSLGMLIDAAGHDSYHCHIYGQGGGIHLASGLLWDKSGNDGYYDQDGVGMGGGHDWAVGMLYDEAGNDYYAGAGITQGGGNANGLGILIDLAGNDVYAAAKELVQGWGNPARGSGTFGILLDLGGKDRYSTQGKDNSLWVGPSWGVGYDLETAKQEEKK